MSRIRQLALNWLDQADEDQQLEKENPAEAGIPSPVTTDRESE